MEDFMAKKKSVRSVRVKKKRIISPPPGPCEQLMKRFGIDRQKCDEDGTFVMLGLFAFMITLGGIIASLLWVASLPTMHISMRTNSCALIVAPDGTESGCEDPPAYHHTIYVE